MTRTYDSSDRLQKLTYGSADSVAPASRVYYNGWQYGFDAAGRRQTVLSLGTTTNKRPGWTYAYNARGEVSEANRALLNATVGGELVAKVSAGMFNKGNEVLRLEPPAPFPDLCGDRQ